ncbi:MAG: hypothetical protein AB7J13_07380 [Pyrinomonadaceae bacterium]
MVDEEQNEVQRAAELVVKALAECPELRRAIAKIIREMEKNKEI